MILNQWNKLLLKQSLKKNNFLYHSKNKSKHIYYILLNQPMSNQNKINKTIQSKHIIHLYPYLKMIPKTSILSLKAK